MIRHSHLEIQDLVLGRRQLTSEENRRPHWEQKGNGNWNWKSECRWLKIKQEKTGKAAEQN